MTTKVFENGVLVKPAPVYVWVVRTEWDGPGYSNPGDAPISVIEGVAATEEIANRIRDLTIEENVGFGHEYWNGENPDTWDFDVLVEQLAVTTS